MAPSLILNRRSQVPAEESAAFGPIAERFRRAGDLERAVSLCRDGLQKFPHHISARVTLGWALLDLGKYDDARTELEQVLRRAPDNLAAIRGLAELHDRSEHTLHLPMDGPGQWPPDEATVNQAAADDAGVVSFLDPAVASEALLFTVEDEPVFEPAPANDGPSVLTAADLGLEMWSSATPAEPEASPIVAVDPIVTSVVTSGPSIESAESPAAPIEEAVASVAVTASIEQAAAVAPTVQEAAAPESAVEQVLATAAAIEPVVAAENEVEALMESPALQWVVDESELTEEPVVSEADIAALIAEADKLEAAAESVATEAALALEANAEAAEAALVLDAGAELGSLDEVALELPARGLHLVPPIETAEAVETVEALAPAEVAEAFAAAEVEAVAALAAVEAADMQQQPLDEQSLDEQSLDGQSLDGQSLDGQSFEQNLDDQVVRATSGAESAVQGMAHAHIAEVVSMARAANVEEFRSPVAALERFLLKVQARRREVMSESVA